jgi:hypothetical protein
VKQVELFSISLRFTNPSSRSLYKREETNTFPYAKGRSRGLKKDSPVGAAKDQHDPGKDYEENSFFTVFNKALKLPGDFFVRIGTPPGKIIRNLLVIILKLPPKNFSQPISLHLLFIGDVMETEHKEGGRQEVNIVRQDAKACGNKNRTDVEWILDISVRTGHGQKLILLKMACRPDANGFPQKDQNHPDQDPRELRFRKNYQ